MKTELVIKCCHNCEHFKFGQLRKTFEGRALYYKGNCKAVNGEYRPTIDTAGSQCELYKQAGDAKPGPIEYT